jgi:hypothetical protein
MEDKLCNSDVCLYCDNVVIPALTSNNIKQFITSDDIYDKQSLYDFADLLVGLGEDLNIRVPTLARINDSNNNDIGVVEVNDDEAIINLEKMSIPRINDVEQLQSVIASRIEIINKKLK